jgi:hypothetical protein
MESLECLARGSMLALQLAIPACMPATVAAAAPACITDYRSLPADHGWRRYRIVDGRQCWYIGNAHGERQRGEPGHRRDMRIEPRVARAPAASAPPAAAPPNIVVATATPTALPAAAPDKPAQRVEQMFQAIDPEARLIDQVRQIDRLNLDAAPKGDFLKPRSEMAAADLRVTAIRAALAIVAALLAFAIGIAIWTNLTGRSSC